MRISNKTYDALKFLAQIALPALGTLWVGVASVWHWEYVQEVAATILAVDTFLGVILGIAANAHEALVDGALHVEDTPTKTNFTLAVDTAPERLAKQDRVVLKVTNVQPVRQGNLFDRQPPLA